MKRLLVLATLLLPLTAMAECKVRKPEAFAGFFDAFKNDKDFAEARTQYPLTIIKHTDDGIHDERIPVKSVIEKGAGPDEESLAAYARNNDLDFKPLSVEKSRAVMLLGHPVGSDAQIYHYHFVRKGACWYLGRIEDHSIS